MGNLPILGAGASTNGGLGMGIILAYILFFGVFIYFIILRPQKKQQKQQEALVSTIEAGDSILTTSGFYGVVIDVMDEVIIVEFGNNKNCRIPMRKTAVVEVEKADNK